MSTTTISHRLCLLRTFFERIIDWDYDDAPRRCPIYWRRWRPTRTSGDGSWSNCWPGPACPPASSPRSSPTPWSASATPWLRIPVGKLHNDRYVPLHPLLVELITDWLATRPPQRSGRLVERSDGKPF
ncbi:MAG TPA: hypothetical protein VHI11_03325 [Jiangellaceae bacterium]|nr:hypothetical protein [Jiangellaceae bacterium]